MYESRRRALRRAAEASGGSGGQASLPGRLALAILLALALLVFGAIAMPNGARAAGIGAQVNITTPIYAGQNNGYPEGPVGTNVSIQGSGWGTVGVVNVTVT